MCTARQEFSGFFQCVLQGKSSLGFFNVYCKARILWVFSMCTARQEFSRFFQCVLQGKSSLGFFNVYCKARVLWVFSMCTARQEFSGFFSMCTARQEFSGFFSMCTARQEFSGFFQCVSNVWAANCCMLFIANWEQDERCEGHISFCHQSHSSCHRFSNTLPIWRRWITDCMCQIFH